MKLLPAADCRWTPDRKAQVVLGVNDGLLTVEEAMARYRISAEEWETWVRAVDARHLGSLRVSPSHLRQRRIEQARW